MAVIKIPQSSRLIIKVQTGVNTSGNAVYRQRSFNNLKADAADADIHAVGLALAGLQVYPVTAVGRIDDVELVEQ
ncbi:DUF1659 domain-containing protein|uniref:DUF1659 domain-containing protein n=1 Tax=Dendrosporobacter quercicolus TaxID=146817 RepID=A0A1G9WSH9_9FIRM|nr:DUF1659 domain-containing protein [Dendrosporobacter quercicolus]NSL49200.1 DUF1659 domain-containing protein [Dendrosporobacter quercicolus DSM 1736]SDM87430.1 Protein of unknown function [Dendrosporobacter quercicolus]